MALQAYHGPPKLAGKCSKSYVVVCRDCRQAYNTTVVTEADAPGLSKGRAEAYLRENGWVKTKHGWRHRACRKKSQAELPFEVTHPLD